MVLSPPRKSTPNSFSPRETPKPRATTRNNVLTIASGLAKPMKFTLLLFTKCSIVSDFRMLRSVRKLKMSRVTTSAVNKLAATPMVSVTPKPLISPVPIQIKMMDEMSVVTCESKIVPNARA